MRDRPIIEQVALMAQGWRSSEERRSSDLSQPSLTTPRRKSRLQLLGNKRLTIAGSILIITIILFFTSRRLTSEEYSFRGARPPGAGAEDFSAAPDTRISKEKAAVIVENRVLANLIPIILHFSSVLGPEWPIHVFTGEENQRILLQSFPFQRGVSAGRFHIRLLPPDTPLNTHASVSNFMTTPWFWEQLAPAEHLLLFQADSILCSNSDQKVEDFLQYDFVGAPVDEVRGLGMGYNGGLSLRSRTKCLEIVNTHSWQTERHGDHSQGNVDYEDQWFSKKMRELPAGPDGRPGANLPSTDVAMRFSVETMWYDKPLGYHQPNVWQAERMEEVYKWCPEYRMCTTETFTNHDTENFGGSGME